MRARGAPAAEGGGGVEAEVGAEVVEERGGVGWLAAVGRGRGGGATGVGADEGALVAGRVEAKFVEDGVVLGEQSGGAALEGGNGVAPVAGVGEGEVGGAAAAAGERGGDGVEEGEGVGALLVDAAGGQPGGEGRGSRAGRRRGRAR